MDFNKEFSDFKNRESEQLAKFGEGARIYRILGEIEMKRGFAKYFYEAGQQSKQEEVNKLQVRIDEALYHTVNHGGYDDLTHIINILKGELK